MSSRIAVMMHGRILQCAAPDIVYDDPDTIEVAEFIGSPRINLLPVDVDGGGRMSLLGQALDLRLPGAAANVRIGLRPEALRLADEDPILTGIVSHSENLGAEVFAQVNVPGLADRLVLRGTAAERSRLRTGSAVGIGFDGRRALLFDGDGNRVRRLQTGALACQEVA